MGAGAQREQGVCGDDVAQREQQAVAVVAVGHGCSGEQ